MAQPKGILVIAVPVERFLYAGSWLIRISKPLGILDWIFG